MVHLRAISILKLLIISLITLSTCRSVKTTNYDSANGNLPIGVQSDSKNRDDGTSDGDFEKLGLTVQAITADIACKSGDGPCFGNASGLACLEPTGVLGACAAGLESATSCYCRRTPGLPMVAPGICSSGSGRCGSMRFGAMCDLGPNRTAGYCAPSLFASNTCACVPHEAASDSIQTPNGLIRDEAEGSDCNGFNSVAACIDKKKGHGCMMSNGALGACAQSSANGSCQCVATSKRPLISIDSRCNENSDSNCRENNYLTWQGAGCINKNRMTGVCVITSNSNDNCECATTIIPYFDRQRDTCSANNNSCYNLKVGDTCAKDGLAGTCLLSNNSCLCATNNDITEVAPPTISSLSEASPDQVIVKWTEPMIPAKGFKIAWASYPTAPACSSGVDVGTSKMYTISNLAPATVYNIAVCAYDEKGRLSLPANSEWLTAQVENGQLCAVITSASNFAGRSYNVYQSLPKLGSFTDSVSSLTVKPGCWLTLFNSSNYTGSSRGFRSGITDSSVSFISEQSLSCDCPSVDPAPAADSFVNIGGTLVGGQKLASRGLEPDCSFRAEMQDDGNFVIYRDSAPTSTKVIWASGTPRNSGARFVYQTDGNAIIYSTLNRSLWNSGTTSLLGKRFLLRGDGRLGIINEANDWIWMSNPKVEGCTHVSSRGSP